jgi:hypothetical protein
MTHRRRLPTARLAGLSIAALASVLPVAAVAGPFGGFSRDGSRYLAGAKVCQPLSARTGMPVCEKKSADEVARLGFRKGQAQRGSTATIQAQATGTRLVARTSDGKTVRAEWDSGNPVSSVSGVYLSDDGKLVAIEYDSRQAGRTAQEVVVLVLAGGGARAPAPGGTPAATRAPAAGGTPAATTRPDDPRAIERVRAGDKQLARKKWKKAEEEYRAALAVSAEQASARYGLAAALAGQGRNADAVSELGGLARSSHPQAPRWLVEARLGSHFTRLQADPGFRRAVGIDPDPARPPTAYERLVGLGGHWEQTGAACQEPTVDLRLDRKSEKFQLTIKTRCQGDDETTRLAGTWQTDGNAAVRLSFPNVEGPEEKLECQLAPLSDRSSEDGLSCTLEDLRFTMRVVRR